MKWPLKNGGVTYLRGVTDTVQTVQYSDSQCTVHVYTAAPKTITACCREILHPITIYPSLLQVVMVLGAAVTVLYSLYGISDLS